LIEERERLQQSTHEQQIKNRAYKIYLQTGTKPGYYAPGSHREVIAMSDLEANKAVVLRLAEVFNDRRLDLLEEVLHPEFRGRGISAFPPESSEVGPGAQRGLYEIFYQAIPDVRAEVLDVIAEGDKVVLVDRFGGTHRGEFFGRPGTGNRIEWMVIHIYTFRDGKILEDAVMTDALAIVQQLGLVPSLTKAAE
jgi:predicted ester cyclase